MIRIFLRLLLSAFGAGQGLRFDIAVLVVNIVGNFTETLVAFNQHVLITVVSTDELKEKKEMNNEEKNSNDQGRKMYENDLGEDLTFSFFFLTVQQVEHQMFANILGVDF